MCVCMCVCAVCSVRCVVQCRVGVKSCGGYLSPPLYTLYTLSLSLSTHPLSHSLDTHNNPRRNPRHTNTTDRPYDTHLSASLIPRTSLTHVDTQPLQRHTEAHKRTTALYLTPSNAQHRAPLLASQAIHCTSPRIFFMFLCAKRAPSRRDIPLPLPAVPSDPMMPARAARAFCMRCMTSSGVWGTGGATSRDCGASLGDDGHALRCERCSAPGCLC